MITSLFLILRAELDLFFAEKVINIQLDVENLPTKTLNSRGTSEDGSTETRGVLPEKLVGLCSPLSKTLTPFETKICDFLNPSF